MSDLACQICGKMLGIMTSSHLKSHQYTFDLYREKFPNSPIVSEAHKERLRVRNAARTGTKASQETKDKLSELRKGRKHSQETKDKIGAGNKGKVITQEAIEKQKKSYQEALVRNGGGFATGPRSQEFKDRMSEIAKARSPEQKAANAQAMTKARKGWKASPEQRETYRQARLKFMEDHPDKVGVKFFGTLPEVEFEEELKKLGIEYKTQYHTKQPHHLYDFKIGNVIIEIDGPFHYERKMHQSDDLFENQQRRDAVKNLVAGQKGFSIYRIKVGQHLPGDWKEILRLQGCRLFE